MIETIDFNIPELNSMKKYPKELFYIGNTDLLSKTKVSIVGSRSPSQYSRQLIDEISTKLSQLGICIVSGGALGIDTVAHKAAKAKNTIMIAGTGLRQRYPVINKNMIQDIEKEGLVLSQFDSNISSNRWNFPIRNETIVSLGKVLIVAHADENSGTMRSVEYALKMDKEIYVLPHRIGESSGTNKLLEKGLAKAIYDVDNFISQFGKIKLLEDSKDDFLEYCSTNPTYDDAINIYKSKVFEYELSGKINTKNGIISVVY